MSKVYELRRAATQIYQALQANPTDKQLWQLWLWVQQRELDLLQQGQNYPLETRHRKHPMSNLNLTKASLLVSTLYLGLMGNVFAAQSVDKQLNISSDTQLQIKVQRGDVTIQTWDKSEVSVTGTSMN